MSVERSKLDCYRLLEVSGVQNKASRHICLSWTQSNMCSFKPFAKKGDERTRRGSFLVHFSTVQYLDRTQGTCTLHEIMESSVSHVSNPSPPL